jgi:hypothetical protein
LCKLSRPIDALKQPVKKHSDDFPARARAPREEKAAREGDEMNAPVGQNCGDGVRALGDALPGNGERPEI